VGTEPWDTSPAVAGTLPIDGTAVGDGVGSADAYAGVTSSTQTSAASGIERRIRPMLGPSRRSAGRRTGGTGNSACPYPGVWRRQRVRRAVLVAILMGIAHRDPLIASKIVG